MSATTRSVVTVAVAAALIVALAASAHAMGNGISNRYGERYDTPAWTHGNGLRMQQATAGTTGFEQATLTDGPVFSDASTRGTSDWDAMPKWTHRQLDRREIRGR